MQVYFALSVPCIMQTLLHCKHCATLAWHALKPRRNILRKALHVSLVALKDAQVGP